MKTIYTGQFNLQDEATNENLATFDFVKLVPNLSGVTKFERSERSIVASNSVVSLGLGGITAVKGVLIFIDGPGTVKFKHDGNANGIEVSSFIAFEGLITAPTIETVSTQPIKVKYLFYGD